MSRSRRRRPDQAAPRRPVSRRGEPAAPLGATGRSVQRILVAAGGAVLAAGLLVLGAVLLIRGGGGGGQACDPDPSGWNGAGAGARHLGAVAATVRDRLSGWAPAWQYPARGAATEAVGGPPSAAGGAVYVTAADGTLVAIDAAHGTVRWTSAPSASERGRALVPPALDGCTAVVATASGDAGALRAVDLATHTRRWGLLLADTPFSAPEIVRGVSIQGVGLQRPGGGPLDRQFAVDGINLADGSRRFREGFRAAVIASPASDGDHLWAASLDDSLYAFDVAAQGGTLRQRWSFTTGGIVSAGPVDGGALVYLASADHILYALDPATGAERWHLDTGAAVQVMPVLSDGVLAVATRDGHVVGVDAASGSRRWTFTAGAGVTGGMAAAGGRLFVVDDTGTVDALDMASGAVRARWQAPAAPLGGPAVGGGMLLLSCADGRLYALPLA